MSRFVMAAVLALISWPAAADVQQVVANTDARAIVEQQREIRKQVLAGEGRYGDLDDRERRRLLSEQDKVLEMLEGRERSTELSRIDRVALFNSLEHISAIINQDEDGRMECERTRVTGSQMKHWMCMTVAERRLHADRSQEGLRAAQSHRHNGGSRMRVGTDGPGGL